MSQSNNQHGQGSHGSDYGRHEGDKGSHEHGSSDYGRHEGKGSRMSMAQAITAAMRGQGLP